jgi:hypothetical protein
MEAVILMNRIDTKFAFPASLLPELLQSISGHYRSLVVAGKRLARYRTLYFDSPDYSFYHSHHNGYRPRFKVRFREYTETGTVYFEVKQKNNKNRTIKYRIQAKCSVPENITDPYLSFMKGFLPEGYENLRPALWSTFSRITLVSNDIRERITIDTEPGFSDENRSICISNLVIAEVKSVSENGYSEFSEWLKNRKIYPTSISKYCTGVALIKDRVKTNLFKEKINFIKKLNHADKSDSVAD